MPETIDADYVDSAVCGSCHQDIVQTYRLTGMAQSLRRPRLENMVEDYKAHSSFYNRASDRYYTMVERDGRWFQRRYQIGFGGAKTNIVGKQINYVIGSGDHVRSYCARRRKGNSSSYR